MLPDKLVACTVADISNAPHLAWAQGMRVVLPAELFSRGPLAGTVDEKGRLTVPSERIDDPLTVVADHRMYAAMTDDRPTSARLPISYQRIPPRIRSFVAWVIGARQRRRVDRWAAYPQWPIDLSVDFLADWLAPGSNPFASGPTPVVLSHDLDSAEGLRNAVTMFAGIEEAAGARSVNFVVPCGEPMDEALLAELVGRGHEIGIHGYDHSNTSAFVDRAERQRRLGRAAEMRQRYDCRGYRSPSLLRTRALLRDLVDAYEYDSSIPTAGGLFPTPNNGCASARPFLAEGMAELPLTMPRDGSLRFLHYKPDRIADTWIDCAATISRSGGVVVLLAHCEKRFSGNRRMLTAYRRFLDFISSSANFVWSTPSDVLARTAAGDVSDRRHMP